MLLSKDAIADCVELMKGDDFYKPAHETIYEAVLDLYSRGEPADSVTWRRGDHCCPPAPAAVYQPVLGPSPRGDPAGAVTLGNDLTKTGDLGRIGGAAYLHTLISSVPTAANAGYYAAIVSEQA